MLARNAAALYRAYRTVCVLSACVWPRLLDESKGQAHAPAMCVVSTGFEASVVR